MSCLLHRELRVVANGLCYVSVAFALRVKFYVNFLRYLAGSFLLACAVAAALATSASACCSENLVNFRFSHLDFRNSFL